MSEPRCKNCRGRLIRIGWSRQWRHETGLFVCVPRPPGAERPCLAELLLIDGGEHG